ncbi:MAG: circadian clock KaiB family protein [Bryobacteraceae bacterium]
MTEFRFKLYIAGRTHRSERAAWNLRRLCEKELAGRYELVVVDVLERPEEAEEQRILATPTLIKELPPPMRRIIGDLSDAERVLAALDVGGGIPSAGEKYAS